MAKAKDIHLWWLWDTPSAKLKDMDMTACGQSVPRDEITTALDCITCQRCKVEASRQAA